MKMNSRSGWRGFAGFTLSLVALLLLQSSSMFAQTSEPAKQTTEVDQLKQRLQQLEQTVMELKSQITAIEETKKKTPPPAIVEATYSESPAPAETAAVPTAKPQQNANGESSFTIYGFAMLDAGYQFKQADPNWFDTVRPVKLPAFKDQFAPNGNAYFSVRQTRFGAKSSTPTKYGELTTKFEFELFGTGVDAGQTTFRLRHAYGELGPIGGGQTWSAFMDIGVFPNTIEYWGPTGMVFFRNVQMRWMPVRKKSGSVTIALERPGASGDQGVYADRIELSNIQPRFNFPDLSGNARIDRNWGYLQTAAIVRKIGWVDTSANTTNLGGSVVGWGINLSSNLNLSKKDVAKLSFVYGRGIENYMNDAPFDVGVANNPPNSKVPIKGVALPVYGVVAFLDHTWSEHFTSSAGYSLIDIVNSNAQLASDFHQGDYVVANLLYHPIPKVMMGGEFQWGRRVNYLDGFSFNDYRMQFSFKYDWDKSFKSPSF